LFPYPAHHELCYAKPRHLPRCHATSVSLHLSLYDVLIRNIRAVARKIPFEDPEVLNYVRIVYVGVQLFVLALYYYVSIKVRRFGLGVLIRCDEVLLFPDQGEE